MTTHQPRLSAQAFLEAIEDSDHWSLWLDESEQEFELVRWKDGVQQLYLGPNIDTDPVAVMYGFLGALDELIKRPEIAAKRR